MPDTIWVGNECTVYVYPDNGAGAKASETPFFQYCFYQNCVVRARLNFDRRPVTGRQKKKIVRDEYEYEMSVDHYYLSKAIELDLSTVFNREQPLYIDMVLEHPHLPPEEAEHHVLKIAYATSISINSKDNTEVTGSVEFSAEEFE